MKTSPPLNVVVLKLDSSHFWETLQVYTSVPSFFASVGQSQEIWKNIQKQQVGQSQQMRFQTRRVSRFPSHNLNIFAKRACFQPLYTHDSAWRESYGGTASLRPTNIAVR